MFYIILFAFLYMILCGLAGVAKAGMDTIQHHYKQSIFRTSSDQQFWDPKYSWKNKYKQGNVLSGEAFPGSTTIFVGFTDGWHSMQMGHITAIFLSMVAIVGLTTVSNWQLGLAAIVGGYIVYHVIFEIYYRWKFVI